MKVDRSVTVLKKLTKREDLLAKASPAELVAFMWELTAEIWSLRGDENVERRLQRNVTNLIKQ
jgi:hypothetical protein